MDDRSPELRAADDALLTAMQDRLRITQQMGEDEVVISFVTVAHIAGLGLLERNSASYAYLTRDSGSGPDAAPTHVLQGLAVRLTNWLAQEDDD